MQELKGSFVKQGRDFLLTYTIEGLYINIPTCDIA